MASTSFISIALVFLSFPLSHLDSCKSKVCSIGCPVEWTAGEMAKPGELSDMLTSSGVDSIGAFFKNTQGRVRLQKHDCFFSIKKIKTRNV